MTSLLRLNALILESRSQREMLQQADFAYTSVQKKSRGA